MRWISMLRSKQNKVYGKFIMFTNSANKLKETSKPITNLLYINFFTQMIKNNIILIILYWISIFNLFQ
jgi:hypothetical protein